MNNFIKKYWLKIFNKQIFEELRASERIEKDKKNFQDLHLNCLSFITK